MKSNFLKAMAVLAFCISAIFSVVNLYSAAFAFWAGVVCAVMGIILEYSKVFCIYKAFSDSKLNAVIRGVCVIVYIILLSASIFFSMSFISNEENENKNYTQKHSVEAEKNAEKIKTDNNTIKRLEDEILTIKQQYEGAIKTKEDYIKQLPTNYITVKANTLKEIDNLKKTMTDKINAVSSKISQVENSKKEVLSKNVSVENSTTGFTAMLTTIVNWHNSTERGKQNPWTLEQVSFMFYLILAIVFEIVASLLWYLAEHEKDSKPSTIQKVQPNNFNDNSNKPSVKDIIQPKPPIIQPQLQQFAKDKEKHFTNEDLKKYVDYMYDNQKNDISPGYIKISKSLGLTPDTCRKIKAHLEHLNVIESNGKLTKIVKPKEKINI